MFARELTEQWPRSCGCPQKESTPVVLTVGECSSLPYTDLKEPWINFAARHILEEAATVCNGTFVFVVMFFNRKQSKPPFCTTVAID